MDLVSQTYWDSSYDNFKYYIEEDAVTKWLSQYEDVYKHPGSLFEFGCFPGRYMAFFGKKGWIVNGMDLTPRIEDDFTSWLHAEKVATGLIKKADVLDYAAATEDRYDLVCSFGFVEHFENFLDIINLHDRLLKQNGILLITTPNFWGSIQRFLHKQLNPENLKRHYLPSMHPTLWGKKLQQKGYRVIFSGYFGGFDFWHDVEHRNAIQTFGVKAIHKLKPFLKSLPSEKTYSPYCGIIAKKM